ncbi:nose resistant to fluoxetine protein 6-like [Planococcus citri]|uniref:nose resistant to fluoxetine protein 6-like n=1 Tax=Planococcus citri TaxID=170843 RepID=UPI0031F77DA4
MKYRMIVAYIFVTVELFFANTLENNTEFSECDSKLISKDLDRSSSQANGFRKKWISELFLEAQQKFRMDYNVNNECKRDFERFQLHLKNQSMWAIKMKESSEWPLGGILSGTVNYMGNYDECLDISSHGVKGQYCLVEVIYNFPHVLQHEIVEKPDGMISAWEVITMYEKNPARVDRKKLKFAVCIPSSCKPNDVEVSLDKTLGPIFDTQGFQISVNVSPVFCKVKVNEEITYPQGYYIVGWLLISIFLLSIGSTMYDTSTAANNDDEPSNNFFNQATEIFSITRNFKNLIKTEAKEYAALHFLKIVHMSVLIFYHRYCHILGYPTTNALVTEEFYNTHDYDFINVMHIVDVFFMISGFLTFHSHLTSTARNGKLLSFFNVMLRWIRMIPVFGILMLYIIFILPYTGDGPLWNYKITREVNNCMRSWWASLLAINNVVRTDQQCLISSYYISLDIQLAIIGVIIVYIASKNERKGILATALLFVISIIITFFIAYLNRFHGTLKPYFSVVEDMRADKEFTGLYTIPFTRCAPYLIGFMTAYVVKLMTDKGNKFTNIQIYLFLFLSLLISGANQQYGCLFYRFGRKYNRYENALYAALSRSLFVTFHATFACLYLTSGLGIFTKLVEWKVWIPLGRLTYSVFLLNTVIQLYHSSIQKEPTSVLGVRTVLWWTLGDIMCSYAIGLVLHLFIEAPVLNLKMIIKRKLFRSEFAEPEQKED